MPAYPNHQYSYTHCTLEHQQHCTARSNGIHTVVHNKDSNVPYTWLNNTLNAHCSLWILYQPASMNTPKTVRAIITTHNSWFSKIIENLRFILRQLRCRTQGIFKVNDYTQVSTRTHVFFLSHLSPLDSVSHLTQGPIASLWLPAIIPSLPHHSFLFKNKNSLITHEDPSLLSPLKTHHFSLLKFPLPPPSPPSPLSTALGRTKIINGMLI